MEIYPLFSYLQVQRLGIIRMRWIKTLWHGLKGIYYRIESICKICHCYQQGSLSQCSNSSRKHEILYWLSNNNLPADPKLEKPELYYIFEENKFPFPTKYKFLQNDYCVLRLPLYHPDKSKRKNLGVSKELDGGTHNFKLADAEALARQIFQSVYEEQWYICQYLKIH